MTQKQYQIIRLSLVVVIAMIISQSLIYKNYLLPIAVVIVGSLLMIYVRRRVKGVLADERDYSVGGKAALLAMQIYSWLAVIAMFGAYSLEKYNPAYEAVAVTLGFSTCILMLTYSVIFRYYQRFKFSDKKLIYTVAVLILFLVMAVMTVRVFSGEDNWLCQNGQWIKHGQPDWPAPTAECK